MTTPEDARLAALTRRLRQQTRREEELKRQRQLVLNVPMLNSEDAICVLSVDIEGVLVLIDADTATVKIPAFQFLDENGEIKRDEVTSIPLLNPRVLAIFRQQSPGFDRPSKLGSAQAWLMLIWWVTETNLDASIPAEFQRAFRPIDVVHSPQMLDQLVDLLKGWGDESYG